LKLGVEKSGTRATLTLRAPWQFSLSCRAESATTQASAHNVEVGLRVAGHLK
jgi:hypothetical protein